MPWKTDLPKLIPPAPKKAKTDKQPSLATYISKGGKQKDAPAAKKPLEEENLVANGLAKVIRVKELPKVNFDLHAKNVEAILINPSWKQNGAGITLEDFAHFQFSKHLLIDGLVFVWVEKEIIFDIIRILEKQDLIYVENVCWVMLDQTKRAGKWPNCSHIYRG